MSWTEPLRRGATTAPPAAVRVVAGTFAVAALAGVEHGVGEMLQDDPKTGSLVIESWPDVAGFEPLDGEPAMTPDPRAPAGFATCWPPPGALCCCSP
jgi:hypothetical protein